MNPRPTYRPPAAPRPNRYKKAVYLRRRIMVGSVGLFLLFLVYSGVSLGMAMTNEGLGATTSARIAEWGRTHWLGGVVTWAETEYYKLHPAKKGGKPTGSLVVKNGSNIAEPATGHLPLPARLTSPAGAWLPGEGVWHVVGRRSASGLIGVLETEVRPDAVHTSYLVGVAWMDTDVLKAQLYSGSFIPGPGHYAYSAPITPKNSRYLVAAFNAGFRVQDSEGGYFTQGKTILPLVKKKASVVVYKDGTMTVGAWDENGLNMTNQVESVRQNLDLIVNNYKMVPGLDSQNSAKWGKTLGGTFTVWRSGIGVTKTGAIVYVGGPSLTIAALAHILELAGCKYGMQLDINTDWVQFASFTGPLGSAINGGNGTNMLASMAYTPSRFFSTWMNRDFYTMSLRSQTK
jgi:hypothetical protein